MNKGVGDNLKMTEAAAEAGNKTEARNRSREAASLDRPRRTATTAPRADASASASAFGAMPMGHVSPIERSMDLRHRPWDDLPLMTKLTAVVAASSAGGVGVGMLEAQSPFPIWTMLIGLTLLVALMSQFCRLWIALPFLQLTRTVRALKVQRAPAALHALPVGRRDEVGQMARTVQQVAALAIRDHLAARRLRRRIDKAIDAEVRKATQRLEHMAMRDPLTDLGNRRFLEENLEPLIRSCRQARGELICFILDMDNFKQVNDTLGHATGDDLLIFLANLIRATVRREDYAIRLGGDEFVLLMPNCEDHRARQVSRQLITLFRQHAHTVLPSSIRADLSIGVASLNADGRPTGEALLERADANLYAAKRSGKGRSVGLPDSPNFAAAS